MPRVEGTITATANRKVNIDALKNAIAEAIRKATGYDCQVIVNATSNSGISDRVLEMKYGGK